MMTKMVDEDGKLCAPMLYIERTSYGSEALPICALNSLVTGMADAHSIDDKSRFGIPEGADLSDFQMIYDSVTRFMAEWQEANPDDIPYDDEPDYESMLYNLRKVAFGAKYLATEEAKEVFGRWHPARHGDGDRSEAKMYRFVMNELKEAGKGSPDDMLAAIYDFQTFCLGQFVDWERITECQLAAHGKKVPTYEPGEVIDWCTLPDRLRG